MEMIAENYTKIFGKMRRTVQKYVIIRKYDRRERFLLNKLFGEVLK